MISLTTVREVKEKMDILDVVGELVELSKSGSSYKALSPFTDEKTPSFFVVPDKGIFKCFSSGKSGDAISFLQDFKGLDFKESILYLADKYKIPVRFSGESKVDLEREKEIKALSEILDRSAAYYRLLLAEHEEAEAARSYLEKRGLSKDIIDTFCLGYSRDQWDDLLKMSQKANFPVAQLVSSGMVVEAGSRGYDRFRGRIMFPIHHHQGKVVGFGSRLLRDSQYAHKYINSPQSPLHIKGDLLYGLFHGKGEIRKKKHGFIVEGYMDVIALSQFGICECVAVSGTSLTDNQARLLKRFTSDVTIVFDGDPSGVSASLRGVDVLLENDFTVRIFPLPQGEDPDTYVRRVGHDEFRRAADKESMDFISFMTRSLRKSENERPGSEVITRVLKSIAKIRDPIKRSVSMRDFSEMSGIDEGTLVLGLNRILGGKQPKKAETDESSLILALPSLDIVSLLTPETKVEIQERENIRLLITYGDEVTKIEGTQKTVLEYFVRETEGIGFQNPNYGYTLEILRERAAKGLTTKIQDLLDYKDARVDEVVKIVLAMENRKNSPRWDSFFPTSKNQDDSRNHFYTVYTSILRLKLRLLQLEFDALIGRMKGKDSEEQESILEEVKRNKREENEIAKVLGTIISR